MIDLSDHKPIQLRLNHKLIEVAKSPTILKSTKKFNWQDPIFCEIYKNKQYLK